MQEKKAPMLLKNGYYKNPFDVIYEDHESTNNDKYHANVKAIEEVDAFVDNGIQDQELYECLVCYKIFQSKCTLECHLITQRHCWRMKKALDELRFIEKDIKKTRAKKLDYFEEIQNEDLNSSEEGYCTDSDENKMQNENEDNNSEDIERGRSKTRNYDKIRERSRRKKMEELKEVYKHHAADRGSNDLYQTMLDSYEDFSGESDDLCTLSELKNNVDICNNNNITRKKSVCEKEALMKRDLVLTELADTEKDYVNDLHFVVKKYIPLLNGNNVSNSLKQDFQIIFGNIAEIYNFHTNVFLEKIEDCLEEPELLKETFCECEETLALLYSQYCRCKPSADEALEVHEAEMEMIRKTHLPERKLAIKDYMMKPVQRLMKYQLLLSSVKKFSLKAGINPLYLDDAIEVMESVPKEANDALNVELISGYQGLLPSEDLIFQESLHVVVGKTKAKPKPMRVFLFEKVVVFTESIKRSKRLPEYRYIAHGNTSSLGITETMDSDALKFAIWFRKYNSSDIYVCRAESIDVRKTWMQVLHDVMAIQAILQNRVTNYSESSNGNLISRSRRTSRSARVAKANDVVLEEALRQKMQGHPRLGAMSDRLKQSIEKYLVKEVIDPQITKNTKNLKRSQSIINAGLISELDTRPVCRPRSSSTGSQTSRSRSRERHAKEALIETVTHVSFSVLDPPDGVGVSA